MTIDFPVFPPYLRARVPGLVVSALALVHVLGVVGTAWAEPATDGTESNVGGPSADLILVEQAEPWLLAAAAPVAARIGRGGQIPLLLAVDSPPGKACAALLSRIRSRSVLVLADKSDSELADALAEFSPSYLLTGRDPVQGTLLLAKHFWRTASEIVVAPLEDPGAMILGSALAAHLGEPLLIHDSRSAGNAMRQSLEELGVERVLVVVGGARERPSWAKKLHRATKLLDAEAVQQRMVAIVGAEKVRTILLARAPDEDEGVGDTAWFAPYLSLVRGAPLVLSDSEDARDAERRVFRLIEREGLRPRSVTILADYGSIGTRAIKIATAAEGAVAAGGSSEPYELQTEPCVPTDFDQVGALGVGRIPFDAREEASTMFARGLVRERLLATKLPRMLMLANPELGDVPLPLCETVSRITANEFRNCRVRVDKFYKRSLASPEVWEAAGAAQMIIFEGHVDHEYLFRDPPAPEERSDDSDDTAAEKPAWERFEGPVDGLPVVVLQTCHSLEEPVLRRIHELGGVAFVGSVTSVHSASGSAFVKALSDAVLYRGDTLGEAIRDARNYLFCLQELKIRRGHQQQAKTRRVALCFRLWGDPELRVFPQRLREPQLEPVSVAWDRADTLLIRVPAARLAPARTDSYVAQMFPGSEAAGMVRRLRSQSLRRITPVYFFRLPLPEGFAEAGYTVLQRAEDTSNRAVFRTDLAGKFLYVLYLPRRESPEETFVLRFSKPEPH